MAVTIDLTIQPDATAGKDTFVNDGAATTNYGNETYLVVGHRPANSWLNRIFLQFDVSEIPANSTINSATLSIYHYYVDEGLSATQTLAAHAITGTWAEGTATWNAQPAYESTATDVGDSFASNTTGWRTFDITALVQRWVDGTLTNNGVAVKQNAEAGTISSIAFYSSDYATDTSLRPKLAINYKPNQVRRIAKVPNNRSEVYYTALMTDANLQGYWRLESDGTDSSANGYNLTTSAAPDYAAGVFGNGADFELGNLDYLSIANASCANLEITGSKTWSCWVKFESHTAGSYFMAKCDTGTTTIVGFRYNTSAGLGFIGAGLGGGGNENNTGVHPVDGTWYHLVARHNTADTTLAVFVNNVKYSVTATGTTSDTNGDFALGRLGANTTSSYYFDGMIDDAAVWNRALSDAEIGYLYNGSIKKFMGQTDANIGKIAGVYY